MNHTTVDIEKIRELYLAGESEKEIAHQLGVSRNVIRHRCLKMGLQPRTPSEVQLIRNARLTPEQRQANAARAHEAWRGSKMTPESREACAATKAIQPGPMTPTEELVHGALVATGLTVQRELNCGPYNIDFAVDGSVAVEAYGGGWHTGGRAMLRFQKRARYLLDRGWHIIIVWVDLRYDYQRAIADAVDYAVAFAKLTRDDPTTLRQYRMLWSYRKATVAIADANSQEFPVKPNLPLPADAASSDDALAD